MSVLKRINLSLVVVAVVAFGLGWQLGHRDLSIAWRNYHPQVTVVSQTPPENRQEIDFKLFWETWDLVASQYYDKKALDPQKMYYGAIQGMVAALGDPYTVFLPPDQQKSTKEELGGSFEGVGIQLGFNKEKRLVVMTPLDGTPADRAGIKAGDLILKINDQETTSITLPEAVNLIRGPKGSKVDLEIFRDGEEKTSTVTLERDTIIVKSAQFTLKTTPQGKKIAYLKLSRFGERTFIEWNQAVSDALASGATSLILDLRNNPGGFLEGAVFIASEFIDQGDVVLQENADGERKHFTVSRAGKLLRQPLVVLINKGSASASEIVAGVIQDRQRGKLVGDNSFGKGTIQDSRELGGGTGIHVTTAKWLTPNGRWIHNEGLVPDIKVEDVSNDSSANQLPKDEVDEQLGKALEVLDE